MYSITLWVIYSTTLFYIQQTLLPVGSTKPKSHDCCSCNRAAPREERRLPLNYAVFFLIFMKHQFSRSTKPGEKYSFLTFRARKQIFFVRSTRESTKPCKATPMFAHFPLTQYSLCVCVYVCVCVWGVGGWMYVCVCVCICVCDLP